MELHRPAPHAHALAPEDITPEARGLFAAGWYATREECRLVHPADHKEQVVSPQTWRALRELGAGTAAKPTLPGALGTVA